MTKLYCLSWIDSDNQHHHRMLLPGDEVVLVGRSHSADIAVSNPSVSRQHAQLSWRKSVLYVKDLSSRFGTWVNDQQLEVNHNSPLYENCEIRLGALSFWYEISDKDDKQDQLQTFFLTDENTLKPNAKNASLDFQNLLFQRFALLDDSVVSNHLKETLANEIDLLFAKHEAEIKDLQVLNSISHILNRCTTLSELSKKTLDLISKVMNAERGFIVLFEPGSRQFELIAKRNFGDVGQLTDHTIKCDYSHTVIEQCRITGKVVLVDGSAQRHNVTEPTSISSANAASIVVVPLFLKEQVAGVIYLDSLRANCFDQRRLAFLETFSAHTSIALHNVQLYKRAITDDLTGLYTRLYIEERLDQEYDRAKRYLRPFSILMVDLDHFKQINDRFGHSAGDAVLQNVAAILQRQLREADTAGRLGGEEFIVILGESAAENAIAIAERIREEIEQACVEKDGLVIKLTASIGISSYDEDYSNNVAQLVDAADVALYKAKHTGRNRVVVAGQKND